MFSWKENTPRPQKISRLFSMKVLHCETIVLDLRIIKYRQTNKDMKNLKEKVTARLIKQGNNANDVNKMVSIHFEYASNLYSSVKTIAECIRVIY